MLDFLEENLLRPGFEGTVNEAEPDGGRVVTIDGHVVNVGQFASERILVSA